MNDRAVGELARRSFLALCYRLVYFFLCHQTAGSGQRKITRRFYFVETHSAESDARTGDAGFCRRAGALQRLADTFRGLAFVEDVAVPHAFGRGGTGTDYLHRHVGVFRRRGDDHLYMVGADINTGVELPHVLIVPRLWGVFIGQGRGYAVRDGIFAASL